MGSIEEKVSKILMDVLNLDRVEQLLEHCDENLSQLGLESLQLVTLVVKIESTFDIDISDEDLTLDSFSTFNKICQLVKKMKLENKKKCIKKCLVLDCDNVLWLGVFGEEAVVVDDNVLSLQKLVFELYSQGVYVCLCSKNDQQELLNAIASPRMMLREHQFTVIKGNCSDKSISIIELSAELNISLDSFVFVDDSDYELGYVRGILPEVVCIKADYTSPTFIEEIANCFIGNVASNLDRTRLFKEQKMREKDKEKFKNVDEYNEYLNTTISCNVAQLEDSMRLCELSFRTNQFNLSNQRYTEDAIKRCLLSSSHEILKFTAKDRYGDMGLVGMAVIHFFDTKNVIEALMLSCRVFDRGFETFMINSIKSRYNKLLEGIYTPNNRNTRFSRFYETHGIQIHNIHS